jgi:transcription elongation factor Elf1
MKKPFLNSKCLRCGAVEYVMVKIGALVMCGPCSKSVFKTEDPVKDELDQYNKWLKVYFSNQ